VLALEIEPDIAEELSAESIRHDREIALESSGGDQGVDVPDDGVPAHDAFEGAASW
jgi:hypothetical protein